MDPTTLRIVCGILAVILIVLVMLRRKSKRAD
jgi:preprotein translocase subunit SecG